MLLFNSGKEFYKAFNKIYFPSTDKSDRHINTHIKVEQENTNKTVITAYGQGGAWLQRYVEGSGITGIKFLVRPIRIEDGMNLLKILKLEEYSKSYLALEQAGASIALVSVKEMSGSEIKKEGARTHFPLYEEQESGEEAEEFGPPEFNTTCIAEVEAETFNNLIKDAYSYGSDKYDSYSIFYIFTELNQIRVFSSCYLKASLLNRSATANGREEPSSFGFNAAYLSLLIDLGNSGESIDICYGDVEGLVTFSGSKGRVSLPIYEDEQVYRLLESNLIILDEDRHPEVEEKTGYPLEKIGWRSVKLSEASNLIEVQEGMDRQIKLDTHGSFLTVTKLRDTRLKHPDKSNIPIVSDQAECLESEWKPLSVDISYFLKSLSILKTFINRLEETETDSTNIVLYGITLPDETRNYVLVLEPDQKSEKERSQVIYHPIPIEELTDEMNED